MMGAFLGMAYCGGGVHETIFNYDGIVLVATGSPVRIGTRITLGMIEIEWNWGLCSIA
jgi:hypothetical protein